MSEQGRHAKIARAAEVHAAAAFGVSVEELRGGDRTVESMLARRAASAVAKDLGLSWPEAVRAFSEVRGEDESLSTLRRQRGEWMASVQPARPSPFSRRLTEMYKGLLAATRLTAGVEA